MSSIESNSPLERQEPLKNSIKKRKENKKLETGSLCKGICMVNHTPLLWVTHRGVGTRQVGIIRKLLLSHSTHHAVPLIPLDYFIRKAIIQLLNCLLCMLIFSFSTLVAQTRSGCIAYPLIIFCRFNWSVNFSDLPYDKDYFIVLQWSGYLLITFKQKTNIKTILYFLKLIWTYTFHNIHNQSNA